jgi:hypothetical protein
LVLKKEKSIYTGIFQSNQGLFVKKNIIFYFPSCLRVFVLAVIFAFCGCKSKPHYSEIKLPLPPVADSGVADGQYIQTEYGFGFPLPPKWRQLSLSVDQEVDEVARFGDPGQEMIVRVSIQLLNPTQKFSKKSWAESSESELKSRQFVIHSTDKTQEWKTGDSRSWVVVSYHLRDHRGDECVDQEWAINNGDFLVAAHVTLLEETADTEKGKKLFKALADNLSQIHWYMPLGSRGISIERYELEHFTDDFCRALESCSPARVGSYFSDLYPEKMKWNDWYKGLILSKDKSPAELKAELTGLVINEDNSTATASFTITKKDKAASRPEKFERNFLLSKPEGNWKVQAPVGKSK